MTSPRLNRKTVVSSSWVIDVTELHVSEQEEKEEVEAEEKEEEEEDKLKTEENKTKYTKNAVG